MKNLVCLLIMVLSLSSCSMFRSGKPIGCPTGALGAEKILSYMDEKERATAAKKATKKTDPTSGKITTKKKGIRTGEIERPTKLTKDQKMALKKKREEQKAIEKQLKRDEKEAKKASKMPY